MSKKIFTLLLAFVTVFSIFGQSPGLVADKSDIIDMTSYPYTPLLVQSGEEELFWIGSAYEGTEVTHDMLNEVVSDFSNTYFIKYDKDLNPLGSAFIRGAYATPRAFSLEGGLMVVSSSGTDVEANGNTIPINDASRLEFIVKYNDLCQFERMVSVWDLDANQYPYSKAMMDANTGTLFLAGTASQPYNLQNYGIIGVDMEEYFYVLSYDTNLSLNAVFVAGMSTGGEYGYFGNLELIPDGAGNVIITGTHEGDRDVIIDDVTLSGSMESKSVFAVKLDKELKKEWVLEGTLNGSDYGGDSHIYEGLAMGNNDIVMVGATSTGYFSLGDAKLDFGSGLDYSNMFAIRISSEGKLMWERPIQNMLEVYYGKKGAESEEFTENMDMDAIQWKDNVLYLTGMFSGDQFNVAGKQLENPLGSGAFVAALDLETGEEMWGYSISSSSIELNGFDLDASGNVSLLGKGGSEQQFEDLGSKTWEASMAFHLGLDFGGNPLWLNTAYLDPSAYGFFGTDLEVLNSGEVFSTFYKTSSEPLIIGGASIYSKDPYSSILIRLNADTHLGGTVYDKSGETVYPGIVKAYKATSRGAYPLVQTVDIDDSGKYMFDGLYPGSYRLLAIPDLDAYPDGMPTYAGGAVSWDESQQLNLSSSESTSLLDITLSELPKLTELDGSGQLSGNISYADDFIYKSTMGRPAKKTAVLLKKKAAVKGTNEDDIVAYLDTDDDGNFVFDYVPDGGYDMFVDIPGLPMNANYPVDIVGNTIITELDFIVENDGITIPGATGIAVVELDQLEIYPNPGNGVLHLELENHGDYQVRVFNTLGMMMEYRNFPSISGIVDLDISGLDAGIYFIKLEGEGISAAVKYVKR